MSTSVVPADPHLLDRLRSAETAIAWREIRTGTSGVTARIAHLHDEECRVEDRVEAQGRTLVADAGPVGSLVILVAVDRVGELPLLRSVPAGSTRPSFREASLRAGPDRTGSLRAHSTSLSLTSYCSLDTRSSDTDSQRFSPERTCGSRVPVNGKPMGATSDAAGAVVTAAGRSYRPRDAQLALLIIAGMSLMVTYVETMVLPAFETFSKFFDYPPDSTIAWILSAYLLVGTIVTPVFGKLGDIYGKKRMLLVAMGIYAVAVSVAGFTPNIGDALGIARPDQVYLLIGARAFQGIGMGMFPLGFALLPELFPPERVGRAQGTISAMFALGAVLGLVVGGFLAENLGWQFTYHTIIPIAVLLPILAVWKIPSPLRARARASMWWGRRASVSVSCSFWSPSRRARRGGGRTWTPFRGASSPGAPLSSWRSPCCSSSSSSTGSVVRSTRSSGRRRSRSAT